jgi:hypothetical protein
MGGVWQISRLKEVFLLTITRIRCWPVAGPASLPDDAASIAGCDHFPRKRPDGLLAGVMLQRLAHSSTDVRLEAYHYNVWKQRELVRNRRVTDFSFETRLTTKLALVVTVTEVNPKRPTDPRPE